jgi:hypothetical protein
MHIIASPLILSALVLGCQVQFVSPYSADVQKRASDMISEVSAWELQMRVSAGTPEADPRNPDIRAKFAKWDGELEAMVAIEAALNPEIIKCDRLASAIVRSSKAQIPDQASPASAASPGSIGTNAPQSCETQVFQNVADTLVEMQQVVEHQCELPWLTEENFRIIGDYRAVAGVQGSVVTARTNTSAPTADQQRIARENCAKIFWPPAAQGGQIPRHGVVIAPVIGQLYDIVYIETRKSTAAVKP